MMNEKKVQEQLGAMFVFSTVDPGYTKIRTPFLFPDGTVIDLYFSFNGTRLSDEGHSLTYIQSSVIQARDVNQWKLVYDLVMSCGVQHDGSILFVPIVDEQDIPQAVIQLVTACIVFVNVVIGQG